MKNPFDQTFFKFLLGFTIILSVSFFVLYFVGKYMNEEKTASATVSSPY
jgi:preprotein translocase subunit SecG